MKNRIRSPTIKQITKLVEFKNENGKINYNRKENAKYDCKGTI